MTFFNELSLLLLLSAIPGSMNAHQQSVALSHWLKPALCQAAVAAQVMDERETLTFQSERNFWDDLRELSGRRQVLADAPPVEDVERFPDRKVANEALSLNRNYRTDLLTRLAIDTLHAEEIKDELAYNEHLYVAWSALRDIRCEYYYITVRRHSLKQLRTLIGPTAYYRGLMPSPVPYLDR